jgi:uncharacterized protein
MAGNVPEERVRTPIVLQDWRHVSFLHWRSDPDLVARVLPADLVPDVIDGSAWVTLTPFVVERFRLPGVPALPVLSQFPETNVRTYVHDRAGRDGLWFLSLDAQSIPIVLGANAALGVPYRAARMSVDQADVVTYDSARRRGNARHHIVVRPDRAANDAMSERDAALVGRWRAYSRHLRRLLCIPVEHQPWPIHDATLVELDENLVRAAGLPAPAGDPVVHYSPGVDVRLGPPKVVR